MAVDDETLSKLLRLKRYEQPPPEYFDNFLREFQQRQRAEMLRRPAWRVAWERLATRLNGFFDSYSTLSYAGASVAVIGVAAAFTVQMLKHPGSGAISSFAEQRTAIQQPYQEAYAESYQEPVALAAATPVEAVRRGPVSIPSMDRFTLNARFGMPEVRFQSSGPRQSAQSRQPRYILDTRPASYEASYSF